MANCLALRFHSVVSLKEEIHYREFIKWVICFSAMLLKVFFRQNSYNILFHRSKLLRGIVSPGAKYWQLLKCVKEN